KKHGLVLEIFYTQGAGETQQAVISGSADIGTGVGTFNTFGAFVKGAPIRVIAATHTGANDLTWYVKADSPIKDKTDLAGKALALESRRGVFVRYLQAYREVVDWMYADKAAVKAFAEWAHIPEAIARLAPEDYYPKNNVLPDRIEGLDLAMADAVRFKYIPAPLSKEQLATLILVPLK